MEQEEYVSLPWEIKASDMKQEDINKGNEIVKYALTHCKSEKAIAGHIKAEYDKFIGMGWNVIVGKNFGSHVFHQTKKYLFVCIRDLHILIWKS